MKPKDPARSGRQASRRAKKWQSRLSAALLCALLFTVFFPSCKDEDLLPSAGMKADITRADGTLNDGGAGLVRNSDGTWTAKRRVPLVGRGRVINNMSEALVSLGTYDAEDVEAYEEAARCLVDTDLTNAFSPSSVLGLDVALNQIVSIRDLNYTYAEGQKVGVVLQNVGGVLSVDVLGDLWVDTYLDGEETGDSFAFTISSGLIDIGLGSITGGDATSIYVVEGTAKKPFDEVRLGRNGVNVDLFNNLSILYAYVGENPIIPAINVGTDKMDQYKLSYYYFNNEVKAPTEPEWTSDPGSVYKLIDDDLTNGPGTFLVDASSVTVDFGRKIPSGAEVGFYTTYWELFGADIAGTYALEAFNDAGDKVASYSSTNILDVKVGSGGDIWTTMRIPDDCTDCSKLKFIMGGVNISVGSSSIHYAYIREPVVVDVSSYFTLADATVYVPNYRFADPDNDATVEYKVIGRPSNATEDMGTIEGNLLKNMNVEGDYIVQATYKEGNKDPIICTATITRKAKIKTYCNNPLTNKSGKDDEWEAYAVKKEWGISIFGQGYEGLLPALVNEETGDFVTANTATIDLINNRGIVGVKAVNGQKINVNTGGEKKVVRAGFVINRVNEFLELDVLKFMQIKLYDGEQEVENQVAFNNNGVSLGLIGNSGDNSLARISIDTDQQFDRIELWYGGTLGLQIGEDINIYYAFWDEASSECANPGEECMELITNANYGAEAFVNTEGLLTAIDVITGIGNIVDGDSESAALFVKVADVGVKREVEVTFDDIKGGQEIGFIMSDVTALANIELINVMQVFAYYDDQLVGESVSGGGLDVKLLGGGDRSYVSVIPPNDVTINKLKLVLGSGVNALDNFSIYGVFLRPDYDGDGVIDCVDDGLLTDITGLDISKEHYCKGEKLPVFTVTGGLEGKRYTLTFENLEINAEPIETVVKQQSHKFEFDADFFTSLPAGYYRITVNQGSPWTDYIAVHANQTTWLGYSDNWNDWSNWSNGVPWGCTDVILPAPKIKGSDNGASIIGIPSTLNGIQKYPDLRTVQSGKSYQADYYCNNIYFAPGAELVGQHKLDYGGQVFIDMNLESGYYHLLSMPLEATITGDMFVAANWLEWEQNRAMAFDNYFSAINSSETYKEQRRTPYVYQRLWSSNSKVMNETLSRSGDDYDNTDDPTIESDKLQLTDWSRTFNSVETTYDLAEGFALRVDKDARQSGDASRQTYHFHFPKSFDTYNYYSTSSDIPVKTVSGMKEKRVGTLGRFMVDMVNNSDLKFKLDRESSGNLFLFGNPMMSHIDIRQFLDENKKNVSSVLVYDKDNKVYVTISKDASTSSTSSITQIAPMEAVFLQTGSSDPSLTVELSDAMLVQGNSVSRTAAAPNQLRLTATSRGHSASCVVVPSSAASDDYDAREDATLLVGSEEGSGVAVYTVAGGKALSIQRMNQSGRIPVGFYLKEEGNVTLSFDPQGDAWRGWNLVDQQTGKHYPLDSETNLGTVKSGAGRFYLERTGN
ncbi:hypothetical protein QVO32_02385 [Bacteroides gallinaceum]|uniref:hypothetical protein n=1 Tax=Bacteroides gallinaceum TaxID=1462571 RepID=UPI0025AA9E08|nr:hypothetical protein [Bacteroides gallinaceum]MDN0078269.1 hypothetical protein [Bacteroides gallinaceum]